MAMLCAAVGLANGLSLRAWAWLGFAALAATALLVAMLPLGSGPPNAAVIAGLWLSTLATAALVYLPGQMSRAAALAIGVNGGAWVGAYAGSAGLRNELTLALPLGLSFVFRGWLQARGYVIVMKVIASWLIAIAALALFVSLTPTPGYVPDHME